MLSGDMRADKTVGTGRGKGSAIRELRMRHMGMGEGGKGSTRGAKAWTHAKLTKITSPPWCKRGSRAGWESGRGECRQERARDTQGEHLQWVKKLF